MGTKRSLWTLKWKLFPEYLGCKILYMKFMYEEGSDRIHFTLELTFVITLWVHFHQTLFRLRNTVKWPKNQVLQVPINLCENYVTQIRNV